MLQFYSIFSLLFLLLMKLNDREKEEVKKKNTEHDSNECKSARTDVNERTLHRKSVYTMKLKEKWEWRILKYQQQLKRMKKREKNENSLWVDVTWFSYLFNFQCNFNFNFNSTIQHYFILIIFNKTNQLQLNLIWIFSSCPHREFIFSFILLKFIVFCRLETWSKWRLVMKRMEERRKKWKKKYIKCIIK